MINKVGCNASKNSLNYRISLPSSWIKELGINQDNQNCKILSNQQ